MNKHPPEVEAKVLETTEAEMLPRLTELGFKPYFEGILKAQWLINPANGEKLRVRQENDIVMIEHKAPALETSTQIKSLEETGFEARDFEAVIKTLSLVGLKPKGLPNITRRVSHVLNYDDPKEGVRLDFDNYSNLIGKPIPEFLEIEGKYEEKVYMTAEALGFQRFDCRNFGPLELFKHYYPDEEIV